MWSSQLTGVPTQAPAWQRSPLVQAFLSLQLAPFEAEVHAVVLALGWHDWHGFEGFRAPEAYRVLPILHPEVQQAVEPQTIPAQQRLS